MKVDKVKTEYFESATGSKPRGQAAWKFSAKLSGGRKFSEVYYGNYGQCARLFARAAFMAGAWDARVVA